MRLRFRISTRRLDGGPGASGDGRARDTRSGVAGQFNRGFLLLPPAALAAAPSHAGGHAPAGPRDPAGQPARDDSTAALPERDGADTPLLEVRGVSAVYREGQATLHALRDVSFAAGEGEFVALIGPSGSGKSTLLDLVAGLAEPEAGEIRVGGRVLPAEQRLHWSAYMRQRDLLMPWRTALDNAALALEAAGVRRDAARARAASRLPEFGLAGFEHAYPAQLSGGMRQRVAFLRTLLADRPLLLLDEPFGALDAFTRAAMQDFLADLLARERRTVLLVTHDVEEAVLLADRVIALSPRPGRVVHTEVIGLPRPRSRDLVTDPVFVAHKAAILRVLGLIHGGQA